MGQVTFISEDWEEVTYLTHPEKFVVRMTQFAYDELRDRANKLEDLLSEAEMNMRIIAEDQRVIKRAADLLADLYRSWDSEGQEGVDKLDELFNGEVVEVLELIHPDWQYEPDR